MTGETLRSLLRTRARAFGGVTAVVALFWLLAVLAVNTFASAPVGDLDRHLPKGVGRLPGGELKETGRLGGVRHVLLHKVGGGPVDVTAWHTVAQCLILVTLAALVVAGLDRLWHKSRRSRRLQTA
jgi:hypothetical protein